MTHSDVESARITLEFFLIEMRKLNDQGYSDDVAMGMLVNKLPDHFWKEISRLSSSPHLSLESREQLKIINAMLAGRAVSKWLPAGWVRRTIMAGLLVAGVSGVMANNPKVYWCLLLIPLFSPRCIGWLNFKLGQLGGNSGAQR